ncbi:UDP-N-acetylmuramate dehydrogenase [Clostridium estertheticum]|uniref:UDP-N-acetylmuramate dehydrogenase n=1 Tax=Clostridium estertheticum TaxID=238834 RepID=UPI001CF59EDB|nr:UDP-N-acetylmuramate dehydrogenase [Clostridium estertheticum]MCB2305240.1 UDP-N-acetylmuramate dehydrogenase [Clostridium estertheticum]MCB2343490.1 UDP-N-acetylmuramate dehydrogenase [Clostridium estertheticum]MCB2348410.1 UDP-N-acetylmuramate dehydrogenase [Clostridium estertheticum]WAG47359.1 UDP-N-acetylmuramate dehydrogenase [Clostridium estertheticum]
MKLYAELFKQINKVTDNSNIKVDEPMENHTSFRVGGPADILVTPNEVLEVQALIKICKKHKVKYYLIGNGSNLLVKDGGIRGVVIKLCNLNKIEVEGNKITAQSGASLYDVTMVALDKGLKGIEFANGIPGSIGGAAAMNAGAYNGEMSMVLDSLLAIDGNGELLTIDKDDMELSYRSSAVLKYGYTVISVTLKLQAGDKEVIKARMDDLAKKRSDKQPLEYASAGSTFKRPEGHYASVLIQDSNLKGTHVGDAEVSVKHSGFIINKNRASATDILELIKLVQDEVQKKFGVKLDTEVKIWGEDKESSEISVNQ